MRNLASIQKIKSVEPIEGADAIEKVSILGWHCVAKKGEFKAGDLCIYFEIDSLLPILPQFEFLANKGTKKMLVDGKEVEGYRLKTIRLRGQISQGLALPLGSFADKLKIQDVWEGGKDVTEQLGVVKYEAPIAAQLQGVIRGNFPSFIPKTDETRLQSYPVLLERYKGIKFYVTEKLDGSSVTMFWQQNKDLEGEPQEFHVCSRNLDIKQDPNNSMWKAAITQGLDMKMLRMPPGTVLQGEIVGEGLQKNPLKIKGQKIYVFNAYNYIEQRYYHLAELITLTNREGIDLVPLRDGEFDLLPSVDEMVAYATRKSSLNAESWVEGFVFRPLQEMIDEDLGRLSFKVINPEYLISSNS